MRSILDSVHVESSSLGFHYAGVLRATLINLWRRKLLILSTMAAALLLGGIVMLVTPKRYEADSLIHGGFTASDLVSAVSGRRGATVAFDASQLIETQSRLLQSHQLASLVVKRIGLERLQATAGASPFPAWLHARFSGDAIQNARYQEDKAAMRLLRGLAVRTEPRVYLIVVSYTAEDPAFAALVANTFTAEFLRGVELQRLAEQQALARSTLSTKLATLGEKHPQVRDARMRIAAADDLLEAETKKQPEEVLLAAGDKITLAQAEAVPSSPNPPAIIGISLLAGLAAGLGLAIYLPAPTGRQKNRSDLGILRNA
jgi:uncharacterized protein involved in exopolysaccharide biosynthesis